MSLDRIQIFSSISCHENIVEMHIFKKKIDIFSQNSMETVHFYKTITKAIYVQLVFYRLCCMAYYLQKCIYFLM